MVPSTAACVPDEKKGDLLRNEGSLLLRGVPVGDVTQLAQEAAPQTRLLLNLPKGCLMGFLPNLYETFRKAPDRSSCAADEGDRVSSRDLLKEDTPCGELSSRTL